MSEVANTGVTAPATETNKPNKSPGIVNQRFARLLTRAEFIGIAAQKEDYASALADREINEDDVSKYLASVDAARDKAAAALTSTTARRSATAAEKKAQRELEAGLHEVQKAAKQKYARTNRIALTDYFVGRKLNGNRANLLQSSQSILDRAGDDVLPGITQAKVKALGTTRQSWIDARAEQAAHGSDALTHRAELMEMLKTVEDQRLAIQFAADAEWPHTDEANAGIRKEFALHPKRPLPA